VAEVKSRQHQLGAAHLLDVEIRNTNLPDFALIPEVCRRADLFYRYGPVSFPLQSGNDVWGPHSSTLNNRALCRRSRGRGINSFPITQSHRRQNCGWLLEENELATRRRYRWELSAAIAPKITVNRSMQTVNTRDPLMVDRIMSAVNATPASTCG
jgi:hypothetical protein